MGIFDGLLGPQQPGQPGMTDGLLGGMNTGVQNNANALMGMGMGLMSGNRATAWQNAMQGYMMGSMTDYKRAQDRKEEAEKAKTKEAIIRTAQALKAKFPEYGPMFDAAGNNADLLTTALRTAQEEMRANREDSRWSKTHDLAVRADTRASAAANKPQVEVGPDRSVTRIGPDGKVEFDDSNRVAPRPDYWQPDPEKPIIDKRTGQAVALPGVDPSKPSSKLLDREQSLRKEFEGNTASFKVVNESFNRLRSLANDPNIESGVNDIGIVYSYMKMLDPTSVVRETEYATAENAGGVGERLRNIYNKVFSGERLTPEMRQQFIKGAANIYGSSATEFEAKRGQFKRIVEDGGMNPDRVLGTFERQKLEEASTGGAPTRNPAGTGPKMLPPVINDPQLKAIEDQLRQRKLLP